MPSMRSKSVAHPSFVWVMLALALAAPLGLGCDRASDERAPGAAPSGARLGRYFPESLKAFRPAGPTRSGVAEVSGRALVSGERTYEDEGREAVLRIIDVSGEPALRKAFALARELRLDHLDEIAHPLTVAHEPAVVQWSRSTAESEAQVLVAARYLVSLRVWPADRPDEAIALLPEELLRELARLR
jgi:hypothetical protein